LVTAALRIAIVVAVQAGAGWALRQSAEHRRRWIFLDLPRGALAQPLRASLQCLLDGLLGLQSFGVKLRLRWTAAVALLTAGGATAGVGHDRAIAAVGRRLTRNHDHAAIVAGLAGAGTAGRGRIPGGAAVADRSAGIQEIVEKPLGRAGRAALAGIPEIDLCCVVAGKALVPQAWISRIVEYRDLIGSGADLRAGGGAGADISLRTSLRLGATTLSVGNKSGGAFASSEVGIHLLRRLTAEDLCLRAG